MADLKEAHLFPSLEAQQSHWYYRAKVGCLFDLLTPWLNKQQGNIKLRGLDFGAGNGVMSKSLGCIINGASIDWDLVDEAFVDKCQKEKIGFTNLQCVPSDQEYDLIIAIDVIEHIQNDCAALQLLRERVRPGGVLVVCVPAYDFLWSDHDRYLEHCRRYHPSRLIEVLNASGWDVEYKHSFLTLLFPIVLIQRLLTKPAKEPVSSLTIPKPWLNITLSIILELERKLLRILPVLSRMPGLSIFVVARPFSC